MTRLTLAQALNEGLRRAMTADQKVLMMGEDVGRFGGMFRVTDGLRKDFGENRVIDTPLAESGIVGTAIGLALRGYRPVGEIQFPGFVFPAFDQITAQLARMRTRSLGNVGLPVVLRVPFGGGLRAAEHHGESPEAYFTHTPGLRVAACSNPADAFTMIQQAIAMPDPVIFLEPTRRYAEQGTVDLAARGVPPLHRARIARAGDDVTLIAYGPSVRTCLDAATAAPDRSIEVVDLRSLNPLDEETVLASVSRTRRCVVVHEAPVFGGFGAELAARITEECFARLEAPVLRVGAPAAPYPPSRLEGRYLPGLDGVLEAVEQTFA